MANSRLERIGSIFSRVTGLLRTGAMKVEDKPLWYDIYRSFPPKYEPEFGRTVPLTEIRNILYPEDIIRAKFQKEVKRMVSMDLLNEDISDVTRRAISMAQSLMESNKNITEDEAVSSVIKTLKSENAFGRKHDAGKSKIFRSSKPNRSALDVDVQSVISDVLSDSNKELQAKDAGSNLEPTEPIKDIADKNVNVKEILNTDNTKK